jgi:hypothetical protein
MAAADMHQTLLDLVAPVVGEDVVEVQQFFPGGRWKSGPMSLVRIGRSLLKSGRLDDKLPTLNVLVVTATRVVIYPTSTSGRTFHLGDQFGAWPRAQVKAAHEELELVIRPGTDFSAGGTTTRKKVVRLTLHTPDGDLVADLPAGEHPTQHIVEELQA